MTADQIMRTYLTARNAIGDLSEAISSGQIPASEMKDLEHKLWAISMYADSARLKAADLIPAQEAA